MVDQKTLDRAYMNCAVAISQLSYANRRKVGAILVSANGGIIAEGFNGTPSGFENVCEENGITKPEVLHAETNAIAKVARGTNSSVDATLYCTLMPCFECAKLIIQAGIKRVVYMEEYPYKGYVGPYKSNGFDLLTKAGIHVEVFSDSLYNN